MYRCTYSVLSLYCGSPFAVLQIFFWVFFLFFYFCYTVHCILLSDWLLTLSIHLLSAMSSVQNAFKLPNLHKSSIAIRSSFLFEGSNKRENLCLRKVCKVCNERFTNLNTSIIFTLWNSPIAGHFCYRNSSYKRRNTVCLYMIRSNCNVKKTGVFSLSFSNKFVNQYPKYSRHNVCFFNCLSF